jgi:hypothetical protein
MNEQPMTTVIVRNGEEGLGYRIIEGAPGDKRLVIEKLHPERTLEQVRAQDGSRAMTPEELSTHFGQLPEQSHGVGHVTYSLEEFLTELDSE